jgi:hypothetical protein
VLPNPALTAEDERPLLIPAAGMSRRRGGRGSPVLVRVVVEPAEFAQDYPIAPNPDTDPGLSPDTQKIGRCPGQSTVLPFGRYHQATQTQIAVFRCRLELADPVSPREPGQTTDPPEG